MPDVTKRGHGVQCFAAGWQMLVEMQKEKEQWEEEERRQQHSPSTSVGQLEIRAFRPW